MSLLQGMERFRACWRNSSIKTLKTYRFVFQVYTMLIWMFNAVVIHDNYMIPAYFSMNLLCAMNILIETFVLVFVLHKKPSSIGLMKPAFTVQSIAASISLLVELLVVVFDRSVGKHDGVYILIAGVLLVVWPEFHLTLLKYAAEEAQEEEVAQFVYTISVHFA
ncbi:unnamed protein product [Caenorhabditis brenneri]